MPQAALSDLQWKESAFCSNSPKEPPSHGHPEGECGMTGIPKEKVFKSLGRSGFLILILNLLGFPSE